MATQKDWDELVKDAVKYEDESARCMLELRDRVAALEAGSKSGKLRGFDVQRPVEGVVERVARAIHPSMLTEPYLYRQEARDAIAETADYLESQGLSGAAGQLRRDLRTGK